MEKNKKFELLQEFEQAFFNVIADYHDVFTFEEMTDLITKLSKIALQEFYDI